MNPAFCTCCKPASDHRCPPATRLLVFSVPSLGLQVAELRPSTGQLAALDGQRIKRSKLFESHFS